MVLNLSSTLNSLFLRIAAGITRRGTALKASIQNKLLVRDILLQAVNNLSPLPLSFLSLSLTQSFRNEHISEFLAGLSSTEQKQQPKKMVS